MAAPTRVVELYSGIGGMHCALHDSGLPFELVAAVDVNTVANTVYSENFPKVQLISKCILSMCAEDFDSFHADMILMSPPCQPFTAVGKHGDVDDIRTKSFLHVLDLLPVLRKVPEYILVENVRGFECSTARQRLVDVLTDLQFMIQEYLLSPVQFGIPNSRTRYYLLARRRCPQGLFKDDRQCCHTNDHTISNIVPEINSKINEVSDSLARELFDPRKIDIVSDHSGGAQEPKLCNTDLSETKVESLMESVEKLSITSSAPLPLTSLGNVQSIMLTEVRSLSEYLECTDDSAYAVPSKFYRQFWVMDLVRPHSLISCCFTKRYGHYIEGAGSILQLIDSDKDLAPYKGCETGAEFIEGIQELRLRFFTPREIANLLGFPPHFKLPASLTRKQFYRVLGNSLNVKVVSVLLQLLTNKKQA